MNWPEKDAMWYRIDIAKSRIHNQCDIYRTQKYERKQKANHVEKDILCFAFLVAMIIL